MKLVGVCFIRPTFDHLYECVLCQMTFDIDLYVQGHSDMILQQNC